MASCVGCRSTAPRVSVISDAQPVIVTQSEVVTDASVSLRPADHATSKDLMQPGNIGADAGWPVAETTCRW